jgi:hypothetical protein
MTSDDQFELTQDQVQKLRRCYQDLKELAATCRVPSVRAAARVALAEVHAALNGQGLEYELYSHVWQSANPT